MKQLIRLIFISLLVISCAPKASENKDVLAQSNIQNDGNTGRYKGGETLEKIEKTKVVKKKIIKDGRLGIKVAELKKVKLDVDNLVRSLDAYYDNESFTNTDYETAYNLKIRIPSDKFEAFIEKIEKGNSEVSYKEIDARDVTDKFIDLDTRLANKQKYLVSYQNLLRNAKNIEEALDIHEKIRDLDEEIGSTIGRLKYLNDQVDYSTLELNIAQKKDFKYISEYRANFFEKLKQSLARGWYGFIDFFFFIISNWVILIFISVIIFFWIKYRKKRKLNKPTQKKTIE